jgi:hypothetical protein
MVAIHERYTRELYEKYGYFAGWLPSTRLALGDVGTFAGRRFTKLTTLADLRVPFTTDAPGAIADLEYASSGAVAVTADTEADTTAGGGPGLFAAMSITFSREAATFFQAGGCTEQTIADLPGLGAALLPLCRARTWRPEYFVVTSLVSTGPTAIVVSQDRGARIDLKVGVDDLGGPIPVARGAGNLSVMAKSGLAASVITLDGATPLFRAARMQRRLLGEPTLVVRGEERELDLELVPAFWDDLT